MTAPTARAKRKVTVSLDADLVAELEANDQALSPQVNSALRAEVDRQRHRRLLRQMLDEFAATHGAPDEDGVQRFMEMLR